MDRFLIILAGSALIFAASSYLLNRFFAKKYVKYILPTIALLAALFYFYIARTAKDTSGFQDLANMLMAIILFAGAIGGYTANIILDLRKRK